jgi:hypothetical protein
MKIYLDNNLGVTNVEQEELTQDTIGYNILKVYIPNAVLTPYDTFTCYYGALLQNGRKVGWFAMEARTSTDADYEENYTLYKATLEQCVVSVEGKVYIGCQVLLGNSGDATLIKKNTAVVQFNVRKSVAINNDILVLDPDQTTTDVLESYKNLLENALTTYATKATTYTKTEVDGKLDLKADKSDTYTKQESDTKFAPKCTAITHSGNQLQDYSGNNIYPNLDEYLRNSNVMIPNNIEVSGSNIKYDFKVTKDVKPYKILMPKKNHQIIFLKNEVSLFTIGPKTISEFIYNEYYDTLDYDTIRVYFVGSNDTTYKVYLLCDLAQYPIKLLDNDLKTIKSEISSNKKENEIADYDLRKSLANEEIRRNFVRNISYYDLPTAVKQVAFLNRNIITDGYKYDLVGDIRDYKNTGGNIWYVAVDGIDDGTSGYSPSAPLFSLQRALNEASSGDTIIIKKGIYPRNIISVCTITKSINIIAEEGCIFKVSDNYTYTKNTTYTNVYQTVRSNVKEVIDITNFLKDNTLIKLTQVTSISEVNDTPNSWYNDGTKTYVRMYNDRVPNDENIVLALNGTNGLTIAPTSSDITVYLENINLVGGDTCISIKGNDTYDTYVYALNCKFANTYYHNHNVVEVIGAYTWFENCIASYSGLDGFNYRAYNGTGKKCYSIEKNCVAFYNGIGNSVANCNGTTIHDGCMIIRINGTYYKNYGGNVADVNSDTISVNLNCLAFDSLGTTGGSYNTDFVAQQSGTVMYLENCKAFGSEYSIYAVTGTTIYVNNSTYSTTQGGGTITITNSTLNDKVTLNNVVDSNGNHRFIEGNGTPATIEGFTATYCKWSLSGTHLMIVFAGILATGFVLEWNTNLRADFYDIPSFILNKTALLYQNYVDKKDVVIFGESGTGATTRWVLSKEANKFVVRATSGGTLTEPKNFRVQFDLLIDSE